MPRRARCGSSPLTCCLRREEISQGLVEHLTAALPELAAGDDELREAMLASAEANIDQVLRLLRAGADADALVVPIEVAQYVRGLVRRGVTLPVLLRSYRLGHAWFWDRWSQALHDRIDSLEDLLAAQEQSRRSCSPTWTGSPTSSWRTTAASASEWHAGAAQLRGDTVRSILAGEPIDEELAVQRLGYELRRHHVALRVSSSGSEVRGLERAAREAAAALGPGEPLVIPSGVASLDVWCGSYEPPTAAALEGYVPPDGVRVAFGGSGRDAGFRRTHAEAMQAARVAALAGDSATAVTSYQRVELVSLLAGDLPRARRFVAAQLGPLASTSEPAERLRETVRVPRRRGQRHPRRQGALRAPEHRDLSRQAGGGADGLDGSTTTRSNWCVRSRWPPPLEPPCWPTRSPR